MLEFIDEAQTPKNILIRAVKNENKKITKSEKPQLIEKRNYSPQKIDKKLTLPTV